VQQTGGGKIVKTAIGLLTLALIAVSAGAFAGDRKYYVLPPVEYDHKYPGQLVWQLARDQQQIRDACPHIKYWGLGALACSFQYPNNSCLIVILYDDDIKKAGFPPDVIKRHEIGRCNGWDADHTGARPWQDWAEAAPPAPAAKPWLSDPNIWRETNAVPLPPTKPRSLSEILFGR
jgi:hypothetical protein